MGYIDDLLAGSSPKRRQETTRRAENSNTPFGGNSRTGQGDGRQVENLGPYGIQYSRPENRISNQLAAYNVQQTLGYVPEGMLRRSEVPHMFPNGSNMGFAMRDAGIGPGSSYKEVQTFLNSYKESDNKIRQGRDNIGTGAADTGDTAALGDSSNYSPEVLKFMNQKNQQSTVNSASYGDDSSRTNNTKGYADGYGSGQPSSGNVQGQAQFEPFMNDAFDFIRKSISNFLFGGSQS